MATSISILRHASRSAALFPLGFSRLWGVILLPHRQGSPPSSAELLLAFPTLRFSSCAASQLDWHKGSSVISTSSPRKTGKGAIIPENLEILMVLWERRSETGCGEGTVWAPPRIGAPALCTTSCQGSPGRHPQAG